MRWPGLLNGNDLEKGLERQVTSFVVNTKSLRTAKRQADRGAVEGHCNTK